MISLRPVEQVLGFLEFMFQFGVGPQDAFRLATRVIDCQKWEARKRKGTIKQGPDGFWRFTATGQSAAPPLVTVQRELELNAAEWGVRVSITESPVKVTVVANGNTHHYTFHS